MRSNDALLLRAQRIVRLCDSRRTNHVDGNCGNRAICCQVLASIMSVRIRIEMLGGLRVRSNDMANETDRPALTHFATFKTASLLAYLAYYCNGRLHPRETLADMLWPETLREAGRTSLRTALASLRRQLEPPGIAPGSVLIATRFGVRLDPDAVVTDVQEWEMACRVAASPALETASVSMRLEKLHSAVALYGGDLLPGFYEDWTLAQREYLSETYRNALRQIARLSEATGDIANAVLAARRLTSADSLDETAQHTLIRLLVASGQGEAAWRQCEEVCRLWKRTFDALPDQALGELIASVPPATPALFVGSHGTAGEGNRFRPAFDLEALVDTDKMLSLPLLLTRFFGRELEIAALNDLLAQKETADSIRLATLTGPGGSGKTRLAIEVARRIALSSGTHVAFASLAELSDTERIFDAIAHAVCVSVGRTGETLGQEPLETVVNVLSMYPSTLLVLDNFEQLVSDVGVAKGADAPVASSPYHDFSDIAAENRRHGRARIPRGSIARSGAGERTSGFDPIRLRAALGGSGADRTSGFSNYASQCALCRKIVPAAGRDSAGGWNWRRPGRKPLRLRRCSHALTHVWTFW